MKTLLTLTGGHKTAHNLTHFDCQISLEAKFNRGNLQIAPSHPKYRNGPRSIASTQTAPNQVVVDYESGHGFQSHVVPTSFLKLF